MSNLSPLLSCLLLMVSGRILRMLLGAIERKFLADYLSVQDSHLGLWAFYLYQNTCHKTIHAGVWVGYDCFLGLHSETPWDSYWSLVPVPIRWARHCGLELPLSRGRPDEAAHRPRSLRRDTTRIKNPLRQILVRLRTPWNPVGVPIPITLCTRVTRGLCVMAMEDVKRQSGLYGSGSSGSSAQACTLYPI